MYNINRTCGALVISGASADDPSQIETEEIAIDTLCAMVRRVLKAVLPLYNYTVLFIRNGMPTPEQQVLLEAANESARKRCEK